MRRSRVNWSSAPGTIAKRQEFLILVTTCNDPSTNIPATNQYTVFSAPLYRGYRLHPCGYDLDSLRLSPVAGL
jgi:hypothetical protein